MTHPAKALIEELVAGLPGVTEGPYYQTGAPWYHDGTGVLSGSPDGNIAFMVADTDPFSGRDEYTGPFPFGDAEADAAHFARCSPSTIRTIAEGFAALEAEVESLTKERDVALFGQAHQTELKLHARKCCEAAEAALAKSREEGERLREALCAIGDVHRTLPFIEAIQNDNLLGKVLRCREIADAALSPDAGNATGGEHG